MFELQTFIEHHGSVRTVMDRVDVIFLCFGHSQASEREIPKSN